MFLERTYLVSAENLFLGIETRPELEGQFRNLSPVGHSSFWQIGLKFLIENIKQIELKDKLIAGILNLVTKERQNSRQAHREMIKRLVPILLALNLYKSEFEL